VSEIIKLPDRNPSGKVILPTPEREMMRRALDAGWEDPGLGIVFIVGESGVGKTETAREWVSESEHSRLLITMTHSTGQPTPGLRTICDALGGVSDATAYWIRHAIAKRIRMWRGGADGDDESVMVMIVIDEAQHMSDALVEELRDIQEQTRVGMAFIGNARARKSSYFRFGAGVDHLRSRFGPWCDLRGVSADSIAVIARHHGVAGAREVKRLQEIARLGGNLRSVDKVLRLGRHQCGDARRPLTMDYIEQAAAMLGVAK
jgi:DNA transposition AAA+ family ATPase